MPNEWPAVKAALNLLGINCVSIPTKLKNVFLKLKLISSATSGRPFGCTPGEVCGVKRKRSQVKRFVRKDGRPFMVYPVSEPGKPPLAHEGGIRDGIRFAWDVSDASVVIGPPPAGQRIAHLMEHGGTHKVRVFYETSPTGKILADFRKVRAQTVTYQPRPFMQPAFAANLTAERLAYFFEGKGLDKAFEKSVRKQIKVVE